MKYKLLTLLLMFALHIFADFHLQGLLIDMKQKNWWSKQLMSFKPSEKQKYRNDHFVALLFHSFEWTFIFMLPVFFTEASITSILVAFIINMLIHAIVDEMKCNMMLINLIQDQIYHIFQIIITWIVFFIYLG